MIEPGFSFRLRLVFRDSNQTDDRDLFSITVLANVAAERTMARKFRSRGTSPATKRGHVYDSSRGEEQLLTEDTSTTGPSRHRPHLRHWRGGRSSLFHDAVADRGQSRRAAAGGAAAPTAGCATGASGRGLSCTSKATTTISKRMRLVMRRRSRRVTFSWLRCATDFRSMCWGASAKSPKCAPFSARQPIPWK